MEIDYIFPHRISNPKKLAHTKMLTEWKTVFKGAFSGLIQFLATKSPLTMMKNTFSFALKFLSVLEIFKFLSYLSF